MKRRTTKLQISRSTLRQLTPAGLRDAAGGMINIPTKLTVQPSCRQTCDSCFNC